MEGVDWNPACIRFTAEQWQAKVKEIAKIGMEYLILMATAVYYGAFYNTQIYAKWDLACADQLTRRCWLQPTNATSNSFVVVGFYGDWISEKTILDPVANRQRLQSLEEIAGRYGHHASFCGWYWPDEARINPHYSPEFINYVNTLSRLARQLKQQ